MRIYLPPGRAMRLGGYIRHLQEVFTVSVTADEIAGYPSRELGVDPIIGAPGSHQNLGHHAVHHDDKPILSPGANRVQTGRLPLASGGPAIGDPNAVNPVGRRYAETLEH